MDQVVSRLVGIGGGRMGVSAAIHSPLVHWTLTRRMKRNEPS